jgi:hypothetical protein
LICPLEASFPHLILIAMRIFHSWQCQIFFLSLCSHSVQFLWGGFLVQILSLPCTFFCVCFTHGPPCHIMPLQNESWSHLNGFNSAGYQMNVFITCIFYLGPCHKKKWKDTILKILKNLQKLSFHIVPHRFSEAGCFHLITAVHLSSRTCQLHECVWTADFPCLRHAWTTDGKLFFALKCGFTS